MDVLSRSVTKPQSRFFAITIVFSLLVWGVLGLDRGEAVAVPSSVTMSNNSPESSLRGIEFISPEPLTTGGPDEYGYQWDDGVPFGWKDPTGATAVTLTGGPDSGYAGPIPLGFDFPFYEYTYPEIYISANGYISFAPIDDYYGKDADNQAIPDNAGPNFLVAPYWTDLAVGGSYNSGVISTMQGSDGNGAYLAVNYVEVSKAVFSATDLLTFQVIFYENGDIWFQYNSLSGDLTPTVGIEDSDGLDGLQYLVAPFDGLAIRFQRPGDSARVKLLSSVQSGLTESGLHQFLLQVRNTGEMGSDTYNLIPSEELDNNSNWFMTFWDASGTTGLTDTNGDTIVDTGPLAQGETKTISVRLQTSNGTLLGDQASFILTAVSTVNSSKNDDVKFIAAIPHNHFIAFGNSAGLDFGRVTLDRQIVFDVTSLGDKPAFIRSVNKYFYVWQYDDVTPGVNNIDIKYAVLNPEGVLITPVTELTSNASALYDPHDTSPALALSPNGKIGVVWIRDLFDPLRGRNYNVFFAILDSDGNILVDPTNITNNGPCESDPTQCWYNGVNVDVPSFSSPVILATEDNRFVISWIDKRIFPDGVVTDIGYTIYDTDGVNLRFPNDLKNGNTGQEQFDGLRLLRLPDQRMLVTYSTVDPLTAEAVPNYGVYSISTDTPGFELQEDVVLTGVHGRNFDSAVLTGSKILFAWTNTITGQIQYTILTDDGTIVNSDHPYVTLTTPDGHSGNFVSVAATLGGEGILTWVDADVGNQVYYALVDSDGNVITSPVAAWEDVERISVSETGQGLIAISDSNVFVDGKIRLPIVRR